jgi:hypothetical protein
MMPDHTDRQSLVKNANVENTSDEHREISAHYALAEDGYYTASKRQQARYTR